MIQELPGQTIQLPPQLSTIAPEIDAMYYFIYWVSVAFFVAIVGAMLFFMWKYRRRPGHKAQPTGHNTVLEVGWTFAPVILLVILFHQGFVGYMHGAVAPGDSLQIGVKAKQWAWDFVYPGGVAGTPNTLVVPEGEPVELTMSATDVLHSFFIPTMRVKRDVVPGMYTTLWFEPTMQSPETVCQSDLDCPHGMHCGLAMELPEGLGFRESLHKTDEELAAIGGATHGQRYCAVTVFCAEYCGAAKGATNNRNSNHSTMLADLHIVSREEYDRYVQLKRLESLRPPPQCANEEDPMVCWGEILRQEQGCANCHSVDGSPAAGPTWKGLWGATRNFSNSDPCDADLNYIRQSILQPQSQIVEGFGNMPPYSLEDPQIEALAAYIRSCE